MKISFNGRGYKPEEEEKDYAYKKIVKLQPHLLEPARIEVVFETKSKRRKNKLVLTKFRIETPAAPKTIYLKQWGRTSMASVDMAVERLKNILSRLSVKHKLGWKRFLSPKYVGRRLIYR